MRPKPRNSGELDTYVEIDGIEFEVKACWEYQPAEPDVNVGEGIEISDVTMKDEGSVYTRISSEQMDALEMRVWDEVSGMGDDGYGDWLYEQRRDEGI